ncbi:MAG: hypothetical protein AAFO03_19655 [Bacteroidota bacterium]
MEKEQTMLIVWKWRDLEKKGYVVDADLLAQPAYANTLENISEAFGTLYDEFEVQEQQPDGTTKPLNTPGKIVRTFVVRTMNAPNCPAVDYLQRLVEHYQKEENDLMVFLHRRDGFVQKDVTLLSNNYSLVGCFLIGDGRDVVYYRPERKRGLLGDNGRFYAAPAEPDQGRPEVRTANPRKKIVFARFFRKVWTYYQHEFYTKIFELREDLLRHFYQLTDDQSKVQSAILTKHLQEDDALYLRVISFIDDDCCPLSPKQSKALDTYGKNAAKAYEFDDLKANLLAHRNVTQEYAAISDLLHHTLVHPEDKEVSSINSWLRELDHKFSQLLEAINPKKP